MKQNTGFYPRVHVDTAPSSAVGQAGGVLLTQTIAATGLGVALSSALAPWRKPTAVHDPAKVVLDLALTLALGGDCLSDIAVLRGEPGVYGPVASDPTVSRTIDALAGDATAALKAINMARAAARKQAWWLAGEHAPDHGADAKQPLIVDLDATLVTSHSDKEQAAATFKRGFGFHPLCSFVDHGAEGTGEPLAALLRPGNAGSNTAADHITVIKAALAQLPGHRPGTRAGRKVLIRIDGAGATHKVLDWMTGQRLSYSVGYTLPSSTPELLKLIPEQVAVRRRDRDTGVAGQEPQVGGVLEPAQRHHRLYVRRCGTLPGAKVMNPAMCSQPPRHEGDGVRGDVEGGTIGDHVGSCLGWVSWSKPTLDGRDPTPAHRHAPNLTSHTRHSGEKTSVPPHQRRFGCRSTAGANCTDRESVRHDHENPWRQAPVADICPLRRIAVAILKKNKRTLLAKVAELLRQFGLHRRAYLFCRALRSGRGPLFHPRHEEPVGSALDYGNTRVCRTCRRGRCAGRCRRRILSPTCSEGNRGYHPKYCDEYPCWVRGSALLDLLVHVPHGTWIFLFALQNALGAAAQFALTKESMMLRRTRLITAALAVATVVTVLAGCSSTGGAPDLSQPTYSQVVSTYPAGTVLNGTVATVTNVNANGDMTFAGGSLANGCGAVLSKYGPMVCYGSKLTIGDTSVTIDGTTYPPGTKLTTDKDLKLVQVSSWD